MPFSLMRLGIMLLLWIISYLLEGLWQNDQAKAFPENPQTQNPITYDPWMLNSNGKVCACLHGRFGKKRESSHNQEICNRCAIPSAKKKTQEH